MNPAKKTEIVAENRAHDRRNLSFDQIPGEFTIEHAGKKHAFSQVNDVSISGMGILLDACLSVGTQVTVSYEAEDFSVSIGAEIIWSEKLSEALSRIGIQFSNANLDENVMLFMTLREYIDDFGEAF